MQGERTIQDPPPIPIQGPIPGVERRLLGIYLDDHFAGAAAGAALARRVLRQNRDGSWGERLMWLAEQIEQDEDTLATVRQALDMDGGRLKRVLARLALPLGQLKLNGRLRGYSPLSRVLEAEGLLAGISAKHRLWAALEHTLAARPELAGFDLPRPEARADEQLELVRAFHRDAARRAFVA
ncbi:MAG: hypothetical protein R3E98_16950 [Gemmatimonadota bacterium]